MSPTAFKQQVTQLISELTYCNELCITIRQNRKLGPTTDALDNLQSAFSSSASSIQTSFNTLRNLLGSRMDVGDDASRNALNRSIRDIQSDIQTKLSDLAHRKQEKRDPELPGFRELLRKWKRVEENVIDTLESLGHRVEYAKIPKPKPQEPTTKPDKKPQKPKTDEVVISLKDFDKLLGHLKKSWVETSIAGKALYINCFDENKTQLDRPEGFIKAMPKSSKPAKSPVHESEAKPTKPSRAPVWEEELYPRPSNISRTPTWEQEQQQHQRQYKQRRQTREDFRDSLRGW